MFLRTFHFHLRQTVKFYSSRIMSSGKLVPARHYDGVVSEVIKAHKLAQEHGVPQEVMESIEKALKLAEIKDEFLDNVSSKESEGCARLTAESTDHDWDKAYNEGKTSWKLVARMLSGTLEGQFLKQIVSAQRAKKVMEIGMFTGYGALTMAEALPADGQVVTIDNCAYLGEVVRPLLDQYPHGKKVQIEIGDAAAVMREYASKGEQFDVIFLDADKSEYENYLKICFRENLLAPNGTVLIDNAFQGGRAYLPDVEKTHVAKTLADFISAQKDLHKVLVPMRDGVYMVRRLCEVEGEDKQ